MRSLAAVVVSACALSGSVAEAAPHASSSSPPDALQLYRAARAECGNPGAAPNTAQLMRGYFAHWLEPVAFGARVLADWSSLDDAQRARFEAAADTKLLAPERAARIAAFCDPRDVYHAVSETQADTTRYEHVMFRHHVADDEFSVGYVLVEQAGAWTLDRVEVPSIDYPGIDDDPIAKSVRASLHDFAQAMMTLAR